MAQVKISKELKEEILRKFLRSQTEEITNLMETLEENPHKGKALGQIGGMVIKEIKKMLENFGFRNL